MLRYDINRKNIRKSKLFVINRGDCMFEYLDYDERLHVTVVGSSPLIGTVYEGGTVWFTWTDSSGMEHGLEKTVLETEKDNNGNITGFTVEWTRELPLFATECDTYYIRRHPDEVLGKTLVFTVSDNFDYARYIDADVRIYLSEMYREETEENHRRKCPGDFVIYNRDYLYEIGSPATDENGKYILPLDEEDETGITSNTPVKVICRHSGSDEDYTMNCEVSAVDNGRILWKFDTEDDEYTLEGFTPSELADDIVENFQDYYFTFVDERLFTEDDEMYLTARETAGVYHETGFSYINLGLGSNIGVNICQEDALDEFADRVIQKRVNEIVDFERQIFTPMVPAITSGGTSVPTEDKDFILAKGLRFNLFFRERERVYTEREITGTTSGWTYPVFNNWKTIDGGYWNNLKLNSEYSNLEYIDAKISGSGDYLVFVGFTDEDVTEGTARLAKSFIRLSFYDSPDRQTQSMLFYSTIYVNEKDLLRVYATSTGETLPLVAEDVGLTCHLTSRYKYAGVGNGEGCYLYLYPDLLDGRKEADIYMKVEFNNSVYGVTVPFIMPVDKNYKPIEPTDGRFPINYSIRDEYIENENGDYVLSGETYVEVPSGSTGTHVRQTSTNMKRLYEDMYIRCRVRYNELRNEYEWYLPRERDKYNGGLEAPDNFITFSLYEPRVYSYFPNEPYRGQIEDGED